MLAAGGSMEPFWSVYAVHQQNDEFNALLEKFRIGNIEVERTSGRSDEKNNSK